MRKNRANNGYVGSVPASQTTQGVITPAKIQLLKQKTLSPYPEDNIYKYTRPTNGGGYGASAFATLKNGVLSGVNVVSNGAGYTTDPIVSIYGAGITTYATPTRSSGTITSIAPWYTVKEIVVSEPGIGYSSAPTVTVSAAPNASATVIGSISGTTLTVTSVISNTLYPGQILSGGGIASNTIITNYITGLGNTGTYQVNNSQTVSSTSITASGTATATATVSGGQVKSVTVTYAGTKYTSPATVSFSGGGTPFATAVAYCVMQPGTVMQSATGYTQAPTVTITPTNAGYTSGGLGEARAIAQITNAELDTINLISGGQNYTSAPTVEFLGNDFQKYNNLNLQAIVSGNAVSGFTWTQGYKIFEAPPIIEIGGWTPLPSLTQGDEKLVGAFAVYNNDSNMVAFSCGNTYTVDWGDGTSQNYNRNAVAEKRYDTTTYAGLTLQDDFRGYKTLLITVTPQAGFSFTSINLNQRNSLVGSGSISAGTQWLDIAIAGPTLNNLEISSSSVGTVNVNMGLLEKFTFIGTHNFTAVSGRNSSLTSLFRELINVKSIIPPSFAKITDLNNCFTNCYNLVQLPDVLDTDNVQSFTSFMNGCLSLPKLPKLSTKSATSMVQAFYDCRSIKYAPQFDLPVATSIGNMFGNCYNLIYIPTFTGLKLCDTFGNAFAGCISLEDAPYMDTSRATNTQSMFSQCYSLKTVPEYDTSSVQNMSGMFSTCTSLQKVPKFNTSNVTNFSSMFSSCHSLREIPQFDTSKATSIGSMFYQCYSLKTIPYLNFSNVTSASQLFMTCTALETVPRLDLSNSTSASYLFSSCNALRHVPYLNLFSTSDYQSVFAYCYSLQKIDELILNPRTTVSGYNNMFVDCRSLREIPSCNFFGSTGAAKTSSLNSTFGSSFSTLRSLSRLGATGMCHSFTIAGQMMGSTQLNEVYTNLPVVGASGAGAKTVTITGQWGRTADNPIIAISKGWTVTA